MIWHNHILDILTPDYMRIFTPDSFYMIWQLTCEKSMIRQIFTYIYCTVFVCHATARGIELGPISIKIKPTSTEQVHINEYFFQVLKGFVLGLIPWWSYILPIPLPWFDDTNTYYLSILRSETINKKGIRDNFTRKFELSITTIVL